MSLQRKYTYPHDEDKETEPAQVSWQEKDTAGHSLRKPKPNPLSTDQRGLLVLMPPRMSLARE